MNTAQAKPKQQKDKQAKKGKEAPAASVKVKRDPNKKPRLFTKYRDIIIPALMKKFSFKNVFEVPRIEKVVINMGVGRATQDAKLLDDAVINLRAISGQQPLITKAKKAISNFKLRKGQSIGCMVTLRGFIMYEFLDRLINIALPRVRDFRGLSSKSFDGRGNYAMGIKEQIIFHEIDRDKISNIIGLNIVICTTAKTDEKAVALLEEFGMPFRK